MDTATMEQVKGVLERLKAGSPSTELSSDKSVRQQVDWYNNTRGNLTGYDCPICKNKGDIAFISEKTGHETHRECECMDIRRTLQRIEKSGLKNLLRDYTFEKFITAEAWQARSKQMAMSFLKDHENQWFYAGGQVGCGKTHLCTAIVNEFIKSGMSAYYMLWRDEIVPLKANVTDDEAYSNAIRKFKEVDVLYIDDFFKTERGKDPTTAEINIAFEILNYRYNNRNLITIISSERLIDEIIDIDEAVGSRIYQRARRYCMTVKYDRSKNYRLRGGEG